MRSQRYPCARAGALVLAAAFALALPTVVQARSSFNNGVVNAADQIINLMANDNESRSDMRHLRQALNQLLDVLDGHRNAHHHHGHMGKGMHHHHHHQGMANNQGGDNVGAGAGKVGAGAGKKNAVAPTAKGLTSAKKSVGNAPGKNATAKRSGGDQCCCNVKNGAGPMNANIKNGGNPAAANRKSAANTQLAGNAKTGVTPRTKNAVGARVGNNKNQSPAVHAKNSPGTNKNSAFGNAKSGNPQTGKAGTAVSVPTGAIRQNNAKAAPVTPNHNVAAKGNAGGNIRMATPGNAKKGNANPLAVMAMHQPRTPQNAHSTLGRPNAGASVGLRAPAHGNSLRRR